VACRFKVILQVVSLLIINIWSRIHGEGEATVSVPLGLVDALERGDSAAARRALQSDIGRAFDLVMHDQRLRARRGGTT
jgi:DNA-binding GntR family transcriptional regulator